jgi:hypothetical protein
MACAGMTSPPQFCEYLATTTRGLECASVGVVPYKHFCVALPATATVCAKPKSIDFKDVDCGVRDPHLESGPGECSMGTTTLIAP